MTHINLNRKNCQVLVVGGGPGGYVAAIRAGQLGLDVILVEGDKVGGTCLIRGCIPSKALIHAASKFEDIKHIAISETGNLGISLSAAPKLDLAKTYEWKESVVNQLNSGVETLLKKAGVQVVHGWAKFRNAKTCVVTSKDADGAVLEFKITAEHIILANGSSIVELPFLPFDDKVINSTQALDLKTLPKKLAVIGAGYIGLELGIAYAKLGSEVTFIEAGNHILPTFDSELTRPIANWLKTHDIAVNLNSKAAGLDPHGALRFENADGKIETIEADKILVTVGRKANLEGWGLEHMGVELDTHNRFIKVDDRCHTSMRNVWAIGDLIGEPMLAHKASAQGELVAEIIAGQKRKFSQTAIAAICFTEPEIISIGLSPKDAKANNIEVKVGKFPLAANGRALSQQIGKEGGFVRVVARADNHLIIGIQAVGPHISEMSGEFALALEMGARLEDIADTIHVHPTLNESFMESAMAALGHAVHI
ncbi:MAG: dihydrolipoyl dehydrogenase [Rhizobiales bacterium]|nr:dihydrolipoyl dehydrogenase [Hyphomicrobiales bacterium]